MYASCIVLGWVLYKRDDIISSASCGNLVHPKHLLFSKNVGGKNTFQPIHCSCYLVTKLLILYIDLKPMHERTLTTLTFKLFWMYFLILLALYSLLGSPYNSLLGSPKKCTVNRHQVISKNSFALNKDYNQQC